MTKAEFVDKLAKNGKMTKKQAIESIDLIFTTIGEALVAGDDIAVPSFGRFSVAVRKARTGTNPQTRQKINIPETRAAKFTAARALKESIK